MGTGLLGKIPELTGTTKLLRLSTTVILYILAGYVIIALLVYFVQERFIFKPEKLSQDFKYTYDVPFEELFFDVAPGGKH